MQILFCLFLDAENRDFRVFKGTGLLLIHLGRTQQAAGVFLLVSGHNAVVGGIVEQVLGAGVQELPQLVLINIYRNYIAIGLQLVGEGDEFHLGSAVPQWLFNDFWP